MAKGGEAWEQVKDQMQKILQDRPEGLNRTNLTKAISVAVVEWPVENTIWNYIPKIVKQHKDIFHRSDERGNSPTYYWREHYERQQTEEDAEPVKGKQTRGPQRRDEEEYYKPFAEYLKSDDSLEPGCSRAIPLGGSQLKGKWNTPDVIGICRKIPGGLIEHPDEVVSVEIKSDPRQVMDGFGQACAYLLFSHRVYLVLPSDTKLDELRPRCRMLGIGLITFDPNMDPKKQPFESVIAARFNQPDTHYINERLSNLNKAQRDKLLG